MFITTPVHVALAPRQTNALSELISNAIGLGNSLLGELMTSTHATSSASPTVPASISPTSTSATISTTSSSSSPPSSSSPSSPSSLSSFPPSTGPFSSSSHSSSVVPTTSTSVTNPPLVSFTTTATPSATPLSAPHHTNKALTIALPIILCLLFLGLAATAFWACRRRRKRRRNSSSALTGEKIKSSYASSDDDGLHRVTDWHATAYPVPAPTLPILQTSNARESPHESMSPAPPTTSPHNPFLLRTEDPRHDTSTTSTSTQNHPDASQASSEISGTLVSPVSPIEMPTELNRDGIGWHARPGANHSGATALWPSRTESSKFDFGFGGRRDTVQPSTKTSSQHIFKVPRRPIGRP